MIRYSLQAELWIDTFEHAQELAVDIDTFFDKQGAVEEYPFTASPNGDRPDGSSGPTITGWVRFETQGNRDLLLTRIEQAWGQGPKANWVLPGSRALHHMCENDPDVKSDYGCPPNTVTVKAA